MTPKPVSPPAAVSPVDLARLEALAESATPGEWSFYNRDLWVGVTADELGRADRLAAESDYSDEAEDIFEKAAHVFCGDPERVEDAEFIAALRNAAPQLLAAFRAVERVRALCDVVRQLQAADPDTGDRSVSFFALLEALEPDDE
jgi:hypothetical protein